MLEFFLTVFAAFVCNSSLKVLGEKKSPNVVVKEKQGEHLSSSLFHGLQCFYCPFTATVY